MTESGTLRDAVVVTESDPGPYGQRITVRLRHRRIHATDCAGCETSVGQLDHIEREMQFDGELTDEQRARLLDIAERCPVHRTLHSEVLISTTASAQDSDTGAGQVTGA